MSCRETSCGRAVSSAVTALHGMPSAEMPRLLHTRWSTNSEPTTVEQVDELLTQLRQLVMTTDKVGEARKGSILRRITEAQTEIHAGMHPPIAENVFITWKELSHQGNAVAASVPPPSEYAANIRQWWQTLTSEQQRAAERWHPDAIRNLDGVDLRVRDRLNRAALAADEQAIVDGRLHDREVKLVAAVRHALNSPGKPRTLLLYDRASRDGHVAVGVGDVTGAPNPTMLVPGFRGFPARRIGTLVSDLDHVLEAADRWDPDTTHAGVAWIGYTTPHLRELPSFAPAKRGAENLSSFIEGAGTAPTTVVGHSYGGVVAALTARRCRQVSRIVLVGAPGAPLVADGQTAETFVVTAAGDPIPPLRWFSGNNPIPVRHMRVGGPDTRANRGHTHYFDHGSASVRSLGIIIGGGHTVSRLETGESSSVWDSVTSFIKNVARGETVDAPN